MTRGGAARESGPVQSVVSRSALPACCGPDSLCGPGSLRAKPGPQGLDGSSSQVTAAAERMPGNGRKQTVMVTAGGAPGAAHTVLETRLGMVTVVREGEALTGLYFPRHWPRPDRTAFGPRADEGFEDVARQLGEYLGGDRTVFELPLKSRAANSTGASGS